VLIAGVPPGSQAPNGPKVKTLLQNIQILSAGQNIQKDAEGKPVAVPVVNMLVTPEQAEILSLASNETRIQLILRNPLDTESSKTNGVAMSTLFGDAAKPPAAAAAPRCGSPGQAACAGRTAKSRPGAGVSNRNL
jgi:pilus assembly protein CpaB